MDELTLLIKKSIKQKYSSTRKFSEEMGIPQTTIVSAIKNGVAGTSFTTVCKMCKALDIKMINGVYPVKVTDNTVEMIKKLSKLDDKGIHTVATVLEMEYMRCLAEAETVAIADKNFKAETVKSNPFISAGQIPSKNEIIELSKSLDDL